MTRQRIGLRTYAWGYVVRVLTLAFAVVFIYAGAMVVLLAVKVSPHTVNEISDYQLIYNHAAALRASDFTTRVSLIAGFSGLLVFLVFAFLALRVLPRPYLARTAVDLSTGDGGQTVVRPRAVERVAEFAARGNPRVVRAAGRLGDDELTVNVGVADAQEAGAALTDVRRRVREQLERHNLPQMPVNVTLTGYDPQTTRDSS